MGSGPQRNRHRILVIDDNQQIHQDFHKILRPTARATRMTEAGAALFGPSPERGLADDFEIDSAYQGQEGLALAERAAAEERPYALAFVDVRMPPGWDGIETVARLWACCPELQVVVCTAFSDYSWADMVGKLGHSDSLVVLRKPFDTVEVLQLAHALTRKWALARGARTHVGQLDQAVRQRTAELVHTNEQLRHQIEQRARAQEDLRRSEERFSKAFRATPIALAILRRSGQLLDFNAGFVQLSGYASGELICKRLEDLGLWASAETPLRLEADLRAGKPIRNQAGRISPSGAGPRDVRISMEPLDLHGEPCLLLILLDVTEQLSLESQLRHSQKMEALGQLASGVAHDFNNLLTVIQGYVELHLSDERLDRGLHQGLEQVQLASRRAAALTRQLLAFSRKHVMRPQLINLARVTDNLRPMLERLIGEHIALEVDGGGEGCLIQGDEGSMEQVVMNLVVNARDAMPQGGRILIAVRPVERKRTATEANPEAPSGSCVRLTVSDTGCGMDPATVERVFEPFFTTKEVGKGTGLGLSTVYIIAKQHGGWVEVESQLGKGSTFSVFLPASKDRLEPSVIQPSSRTTEPRRTGERILVAEDDALLRDLIRKALTGHGYAVETTSSGAEALALVEREGIGFDLLLTDMLMPGGVDGVELARRLCQRKPDLRVLFTSGCSPEMFPYKDVTQQDTSFLSKPFMVAELLLRVRRRLDEGRPGP